MADVPLMNNPMTTAGDVIYGGASGTPTRLAVGTAAQVLTVNAGATAPEWASAASATGGADIVLKAADETVNGSSVLQNDDELLFAAGTSNSYLVKAYLYYSSAAAADIKFAFTVPAGAAIRLSHDAGRDAAGSANFPDTVVTTSGTACGTHTGQGVGTVRFVELTCYVRTTGTGGNVTLQWAQQVSDATNTVVHLGSSLFVYTMA